MVKKQRVLDLNLNTKINDVFFLKDIEFRVRRDKKTVDMFFKIADKTGEIEAINWDISDDKVKKLGKIEFARVQGYITCLLYTSPSPRDRTRSRMPSSA